MVGMVVGTAAVAAAVAAAADLRVALLRHGDRVTVQLIVLPCEPRVILTQGEQLSLREGQLLGQPATRDEEQ